MDNSVDKLESIDKIAKDIHNGHRKRMKERAVCEGVDSLEPHNILELLLFFAIPRVDTNVLAHTLINSFGSLSEVFDAPYEELVKLPHITENAAALIKLIPEFSRAYLTDKHADVRVFDTPEKIGEYFVSRFVGYTNEVVFLMLLDSSLQLISCDMISKGSVIASSVNVRMIIDKVVRHNACAVVLAHNHPRGLAMPSADDLTVTGKIKLALKAVDVRFVDHVIVAQNDYVSLIGSGYVKD